MKKGQRLKGRDKAGRVFSLQNVSVQKKILGSLSILMLLAFMTYLYILNTYYKETESKSIELISRMNRQAVDRIENYIQDLTYLTTYPLYDDENISLMVYMKNKMDQFDKKNTFSTDSKYIALRRSYISSSISLAEEEGLTNLINAISGNKEYIFASFLFETKGFPLANYLPVGVLADPYIPYEEDWFSESLEASGLSVVSDVFPKMHTIPASQNESDQVFCVSRAIKDLNSVDILGVISIFVDTDLIKEALDSIYSIPGESIFIINRDGEVIYGLDESVTDTGFTDMGNMVSGENKWTEQEGQRFLVMPLEIRSGNWTFLRIVPEKGLEKDLTAVKIKLTVVIIGFFLFCILAALILSRGITTPMKRLLDAMKTAEEGDLSARYISTGTDEVNQLGEGFNSMINEIEDLVEDVYIANYREKEAELNALQAQINPHFI